MRRSFITFSVLLVMVWFFWIFDSLAYLTVDGRRFVLIPGNYCVFIGTRAYAKQPMTNNRVGDCGSYKDGIGVYLPIERLLIDEPSWIDLAPYKKKYETDYVRVKASYYDIVLFMAMILLSGIVALRWIFYVRRTVWKPR